MEKRGNKVQVMMTDEELKILDKTASERGLTRSALLRSLLLEAAQKNASIGGQTTTPPMEIIVH